MKRFDRLKAVVSLDAIAHNFAEMKKNIAEGTKMIAVIKADGYGHGAEAIARLTDNYSYIWGYAVATAEEALQLRSAGVEKPILILGLVFEEYFREMVAGDIRLTVCEYETAKKLSREAVRQDKTVHIHIGLDTVNLKGRGFETFVKVGDKVKKNMPILKFDDNIMDEMNIDKTTMVIFTAGYNQSIKLECYDREVHRGETLIK